MKRQLMLRVTSYFAIKENFDKKFKDTNCVNELTVSNLLKFDDILKARFTKALLDRKLAAPSRVGVRHQMTAAEGDYGVRYETTMFVYEDVSFRKLWNAVREATWGCLRVSISEF